jgi:cyanophycin synthetase
LPHSSEVKHEPGDPTLSTDRSAFSAAGTLTLVGGSTERLRAALSASCPGKLLRLLDVAAFEGPNCYAGWPSVRFTIETGPGLPAQSELLDCLRPLFPDALARRLEDKRDDPTGTPQLAELIACIVRSFVTRIFPFATGLVIEQQSNNRAACTIESFGGIPTLTMLQVALTATGRSISRTPFDASEQRMLGQIEDFCSRHRANSESAMLIRAAQERNVPFLQIAGERDLWQFGWGVRSRLFWAHSSNDDGAFAHVTSRDKHVSKQLFRSLGLPAPPGGVVRAGEDFGRAAQIAGWPCVVKPLDRGGGRGVNADIRNPAELRRAVAIARAISPDIIIESHVPGLDHRLVVIDGKLAMAARRDPPTVTGDDESTIGELIELLNAKRLREKANGLKLVPVDEALDATLASQGLTRASVLAAGATALLRRNANHATGGTFSDALGAVHPQIEKCAVALARGSGFRLVGLDYLTTDISRSHREVGGAFIEMNATPTLSAFVSGKAGPREIGDWALGAIPARIPVCTLILPADMQADVTASLDPAVGANVAVAGARWSRVGSYFPPANEPNPVRRVEALLRYPSAATLLILWSAEDLCRFGLPLDAVDRVIVQRNALPSQWSEMLARHSGRTMTASTSAEFVALAAEFLAETCRAEGSGP